MGKTVDRILNGIDLMQYMEQHGFHPVPIGSCYTLKEHDSVRIYPESNTYFQSSRINKRLNVINFVEWYYNLTNKEAIKKLASELNGHDFIKHKERKKPTIREPTAAPGKFILPEKTKDQYKHVFAYLNKTRCIDRSIIQNLVNRDILYQDIKRNATFVTFDAENNPCYCYQRGTNDQKPFKKIVSNGDNTKGSYINNNATKLFVSESPIDNCSIMTMLKKYGHYYLHYDYLATCGPSLKSLIHQVTNRPQIKTVYLAFDNDQAGNNYRLKARVELQGIRNDLRVIDKRPVLKDFNQDLKALVQVQSQAQKINQSLSVGRK